MGRIGPQGASRFCHSFFQGQGVALHGSVIRGCYVPGDRRPSALVDGRFELATFAYSTVPGKIGTLLEKIQEVGIPKKATLEWLKSLGFTSSNDGTLIPVLKQVGLVDGSGVPTQRWKDFRGKDGKQALADAIRTGYADLFATYPDADKRPNSDLDAFFKTHTDAGQQAIDKTVRTFKALAGAADFSVAAGAAPTTDTSTAPEVQGPTIKSAPPLTRSQGVTININVQLVLPESTDEEVYRKFFAAMQEHLISPGK